MNIGIVGLGLMGGSIAKALKKYTGNTVVGIDRDENIINEALACGAIDRRGGVEDCDAVYLCLYPQACISFFEQTQFKRGAVVTDICGVKQALSGAIGSRAGEKDVRYIGSHPMAGRERSGFAASDADLFRGASYIITPDENTDDMAEKIICELAVAMGCARITKTTPQEHDRIIAYTSQLAHVVSNAYIKNSAAEKASGFTAGSFLDLTRVARLNPEMWTELFLSNRGFLLGEIDELLSHIAELQDALQKSDGDALRSLLEQGSRRKQRLDDSLFKPRK